MPKKQKGFFRRSKFRIDEITLILIVAIIVMIVSFYSSSKPAVTEAEKITAIILDNEGMSFAKNGIIDETKLQEINNMSYDEIKESFNADYDFCIYVEDDKGNIILAKGSGKFIKDISYCKE